MKAPLDTEPAVEQIGPEPDQDDVSFKLPEKWKWVQFGCVMSLNSGTFLKSSNISGELTSDAKFPCYGANGVRGYTNQYNVTEQAILIGRVGACGAINVVRSLAYVTDNAFISKVLDSNIIDIPFVFNVLLIANFKRFLKKTAQPSIAGSDVKRMFIPLPPIEEQRRIVERIEQLFAEVDKMSACKAP